MKTNDFLANYVLSRGMQNINKSEYDQVVFYWLIKKQKLFGGKDFADMSPSDLYKISDTLHLDINAVKKLLKKMPFIQDETEEKSNSSFEEILLKYLHNAIFSKQDKSISLFIENPIELDAVKRILSEKGESYDSSFVNSNLRIPFRSLPKILSKEHFDFFIKNLEKSIEEYEKLIPAELSDKKTKIAQEKNEMKKENSPEKISSIAANIFTIISSVSTVVTTYLPIFFKK